VTGQIGELTGSNESVSSLSSLCLTLSAPALLASRTVAPEACGETFSYSLILASGFTFQ